MSDEVVKILKQMKKNKCEEPRGYVEYMLIEKPLSMKQIEANAYPFTKDAVRNATFELLKEGIIRKVSALGVVVYGLVPAEDYLTKEAKKELEGEGVFK